MDSAIAEPVIEQGSTAQEEVKDYRTVVVIVLIILACLVSLWLLLPSLGVFAAPLKRERRG